MNDTIYRQAAIDATNKALDRETLLYSFVRKVATDAVKALPSAQPETAKRIVAKSRNGITLWYQCEICNEPVDAWDNYCSGCGRRLNG